MTRFALALFGVFALAVSTSYWVKPSGRVGLESAFDLPNYPVLPPPCRLLLLKSLDLQSRKGIPLMTA
jgi:hypothetical protein